MSKIVQTVRISKNDPSVQGRLESLGFPQSAASDFTAFPIPSELVVQLIDNGTVVAENCDLDRFLLKRGDEIVIGTIFGPVLVADDGSEYDRLGTKISDAPTGIGNFTQVYDTAFLPQFGNPGADDAEFVEEDKAFIDQFAGSVSLIDPEDEDALDD